MRLGLGFLGLGMSLANSTEARCAAIAFCARFKFNRRLIFCAAVNCAVTLEAG